MRTILIVSLSLLFTGCASLYPIGGAIVGGASGAAIGGIPGAALGAGCGSAAGSILAGDKELKQAKEELAALSSGDVARMIELQAGKEQSGFDAVVDGIYRVLWLLGVGMAIWFILPWIWAKWHVKKAVEKHVNGGTK